MTLNDVLTEIFELPTDSQISDGSAQFIRDYFDWLDGDDELNDYELLMRDFYSDWLANGGS